MATTVALRERGVYLLPDGRRVVACEVNERGDWGHPCDHAGRAAAGAGVR